ncbi:MAG TPA: hypothetical protein DCW55_00690 [Candidatus Pacebacteria bacterium]|nr:hypothetical protein [Candidatus Paceibacterota bacterium]
MKIISKNNSIHVDKPEGSSVDYYIFREYELHYNEIKSGTVQQWHHHPKIHESLFIIEGEIEAHWLDEAGKKQMQLASAGDVVQVEDTPHTFVNNSGKVVKLIAFRFVPTGEDKREIIKSDKVLDEVN